MERVEWQDALSRVHRSIELREYLKPSDLMVVVSDIVALWRQGAYTSATALTRIQQVIGA